MATTENEKSKPKEGNTAQESTSDLHRDLDERVHEQEEPLPDHPAPKDIDELVHEKPVIDTPADTMKEIDEDDAIHSDTEKEPDI